MWIVFWANILLIIALILLPDISLYYSPSEDNPIKIEYLLFVFTIGKSKRKKKIKHKRILLSLALDLLRNSRVIIAESEEDSISSSALLSFLSLSFLFTKMALVGFLRANAKSAKLCKKLDYDALIKIKIPLYHLFISLFKYPYYIVKENFRRRINE